MRLSGLEIQQAVHGRWLGDVPDMINGLVTDTRNFKAGQAFLALHGPNFDGHKFAFSVADRAEALIGDAEGIKLWEDLQACQLEVPNTLQALGEIAHAWRMQLQQTTVIAISGSYGKTSLRSMLSHGFAALGFNVAATHANLNNLVGVPQTLLGVTKDADIALIECGISETGEMSRLAAIVHPDIAILTGITSAHTEGLGGLSGVVHEKATLFDHLTDFGWCVLGEGVEEQLTRQDIEIPGSALIAETAGAVQWQLYGKELHLSDKLEEAVISLELPARHWAANVALASGIILRLSRQLGKQVSLKQIVAILAEWQAPTGRMQQIRGINGCLILDDSYNANPVSMQAALDTLVAMEGHRVALLGDMAELGDSSIQAHAGINLSGLDEVYLIGPEMKALAAIHSQARWFESTEDAISYLSDYSPERDAVILVKASRSMALEGILKLLSDPFCEEGMAHAI
jgi:UDP-N-acetylmuramoyl-tripeptide--D-alanyl-D-alanine ligase